MKCQYCDARAVSCLTVPVGEVPKDPRREGTQADNRKVVIIRTCWEHRGRLS